MGKAIGISARVAVRIDAEQRAALAQFMAENGLTASQAVRVAIAKLTGEGFDRHAFREGIALGVAAIKRHIQHAATSAIEELG